MSEEPTPKEGWDVPARPPLIAMVVLIASLIVAVTAFGHVYSRTIEQQTKPPVVAFPQPELERVQTPPDQSRADYRQAMPAAIDRAMAETARQGDALWQGAKP